MEKISQCEISVAVAAIEKRFPNSVEAVELMVQYMGWREAGVTHEDAMKQLLLYAEQKTETKVAARHTNGNRPCVMNWKSNIETRKGE